MLLENDLPLVVKYAVASLGEIKLCLAPLPSSYFRIYFIVFIIHGKEINRCIL